MTFAAQVLRFIQQLNLPLKLPGNIQVMEPFKDPVVWQAFEQFYRKFYNDARPRHIIIGINPGRFGGGITGIPFTDPIRLQHDCGIANGWPKKQELSAVFIYDMIQAFGGVHHFYKKFYITAVSPLGFTREGKNMNYYDERSLQESIRPFAVDCLQKQLGFGIHRNMAFCLGDGKNFRYLSELNAMQHFFEKIIPLPHPRFIMQYRSRQKQDYIHRYILQLESAGTLS